MQKSGLADILHTQQIKQIISRIKQFKVQQYSSKFWFVQDQQLQKLNMQIHVNAFMNTDQFMLEQFTTQDKLKPLIYDLILTEIWKSNVLPLLRSEYSKLNTFKCYMAIYHEAVVCNLLEVMLYHLTGITESGEYLVEIIDYSYRKLVRLINKHIEKHRKQQKQGKNQKIELSEQQMKKLKIQNIINRTPEEQYDRQYEDIEFSVTMMAISIVRYVTDYVKHLQIGIIHHLVVECNIYGILVPLIEAKPWLRVNEKNEREKFENNKWNVLQKHQYSKLPKVQAQVWIALYNLFMDPECRKKYELTEDKKSLLLRLRKYMNQILLDQIPNLSIMLRSLEQLSLLNVPSQPINNPFIVQQIPELRNRITYNRDWKKISEIHRVWLSNNEESLKQDMKRLAELYSNSSVEGLMEGFKCGLCKKEAFKRCSRCKNVWYCSQQCQKTDWKQHKLKCAVEKKKQEKPNQRIEKVETTKNFVTQID